MEVLLAWQQGYSYLLIQSVVSQMSILPKVLAWAAAILGVFLLYSALFPQTLPAPFNIACYLSHLELNSTSSLQARILTAKHSAPPALYHHRLADPLLFQKKVMAVAFAFDKYVQRLAEQQELRHQDLQIYQAIGQARKDHTECQQQIQNAVNKSSCLSNWNQYERCHSQVNILQARIKTLIEREQALQEDIRASIREPKDNQEDSPQVRAEKVYNESMRRNDGELEDYRQRLHEAEGQARSAREIREKAEDRRELKEHTYRDCWQNRRIYRQCEEISQQVKSLNLGTLRQLEQQVEAKRRLLEEMREMMIKMGKNEHRKMPEHWSEMYQTHRLEYKQMHRDFIHYNAQMEKKACGCTEEQERNYKEEVDREKRVIAEQEEELRRVQLIIDRLAASIQDKEAERDRIIAEYQQALKQYATSAPVPRESHLIKLKKQLENNRNSILSAEEDFNAIDQRCKIVKARLAASVKDIDRVEECLAKKQYLEQLRAQTAKYLEPSRSLSQLLESKRVLREALSGLSVDSL